VSIDSRYASDVASVDAIIAAMYDVISGPAGPRDEARERHLFHPHARLMRGLPSGAHPLMDSATPGLRVFTVDEFLASVFPMFLEREFYESELGREEFRFGRLVHVVSAYESHHRLGEPAYARGINSVQLWFDAGRWWIVNMIWDWEAGDVAIPAHLSTRSKP